MIPVLLTAAMVAGADERAAAAPDVEGKWLIVYAEEGGKRNTTWEQQVATVKGTTLSYSKEGDERSIRLAFGSNQTLKATASGGKEGGDKGLGAGELSGVYISGQDYLCLSLNHGGDGRSGESGTGTGTGTGAGTGKSSGSFILILRKQR